ncbi:transglutaminase-like cysteine peptidase [Campylobacter gastrosuis]|uniref:Transglutaminase-like cysteine peptidase n=1 Tax=Campylobacter gastrosuis TaxID=2974576 RepID=A0ABT7HR23_9BACT|nr:transglutaminase-like cysteine peptidase [Campylobacter gastrosuis]MDL0089361.1 transglutaminase-like cysteine peptidase [Campylobacter gastrosuis]
MVRILIYLFLLVVALNSATYELSNENLARCGSNEICKNVLNHYANFMKKTQTQSDWRKIELVNSYINTIKPRYDDFYNKNVDVWSTRGEFLRSAGGDCEEYAISKKESLKDLGVNSKTCLLVVKEKLISKGGYHMVLALWQRQGDEPVILDNLSFRVLPLSKRYDLEPLYCLMDAKYYKLKNNGKILEPLNIRMQTYESLLQKEKVEKFWR